MITETKKGKVEPKIIKPVKTRLSLKSKQSWTGILFISPWIIGFLAFFAYPLYRTVFMSFHNVSFGLKTGWRYKWVGMENYQRIMFEETDFVVAAQNFFVQTLLYVPVIIALSIIIAVLLNQKIKGKIIFRLLFFLPVIILSGKLMENMDTYGGMSLTANEFILESLYMIIPSKDVVLLITSLFELIVQLLWFSAVPILIFLASLQKISKEIYEAASIDGASPWSSFWKITLPMVYPLVSVCVIYVVVFLANFETNPINSIIMQSKYDGSRREGYASALSILYSLVQLAVIAILYYSTHSRSTKGR
ncbi:sugar ABC transporter permease [Paenibacillus sp. KQZ6P-2]|uniref:Sugar ABC transporter permease n=1 Tax=Paenibacillus mangrovi TaxID=2931978 RepID=A0A9X1WK81_9BACL|nr:sugar ABC transporter permease [Paenibacillus mangrovi]MCJ8010857.1 sugar ABC transporter permease [Paenibacillus mangrovi]